MSKTYGSWGWVGRGQQALMGPRQHPHRDPQWHGVGDSSLRTQAAVSLLLPLLKPRQGPLAGCALLSSGHPSPQAQLIAQSIGQAFSVAYQEFLRANGINPEDLSQKEYSDIINTQEMYNDDLIHFSNSENCKEVGGSVRELLMHLGGGVGHSRPSWMGTVP